MADDDDQTFGEFVGGSGKMPDSGGAVPRSVDLVGEVFAGEDDSTFLIRMSLSGAGDYVIEGRIDDVSAFEIAFEDSAGRKTTRVRVPETATVKIVMSAAQMSGVAQRTAEPEGAQQGIGKPDTIKQLDPIKQQDPVGPKPDPIKQFDPIGPKPDPIKQIDPIGPKPDPIKQQDPIGPKPDPIKQFDPKQGDPKGDPKPDPIKQFDPKQGDPKGDPKPDPIKQFDPKGDPKPDPIKQFDPKGDPKPDPIGPGPFVQGTVGPSQTMVPFVLASQMFGPKQGF
jgi:hypothetical protein